jgi:hypothetical protein
MGHRGVPVIEFLSAVFRSPPPAPQRPAFDQAQQKVENQININSLEGALNIGRAKIPPNIDRFIYCVDRRPQFDALQTRLSTPRAPNPPICAIAFGLDEDLPEILGSALFEYLQSELVTSCRLRAFLPPKTPVCRPWPLNSAESDDLWKAIGVNFLDMAALGSATDARAALEGRSGSTVFGFEMNVTIWDKHQQTLINWIASLRDCRVPNDLVALTLIVVSGSKSNSDRLDALHRELEARYAEESTVLILPPLAPVDRGDFTEWHRQLITLAGNSLDLGDLTGMPVKLFPDERVPRRMVEFWADMRKAIREAVAGS